MSITKAKKKDVQIGSRMNATRKKRVAVILKKSGMNHSEAINLFYAQVELLKDLPFDTHIPNEKTAKVMRDGQKGINVKHYNTIEELFKDLEL